jgi:hypothetical protein
MDLDIATKHHAVVTFDNGVSEVGSKRSTGLATVNNSVGMAIAPTYLCTL